MGNVRVLMVPHLSRMGEESGIRRVIEAYFKYLPEFGYELVEPDSTNYDLKVSHAGASYDSDVTILHGLYWTGDYPSRSWQWRTNADVITSIRGSKSITVPSRWVAETLQRDMHISPYVVPHGIDWEDWQHKETHQGYVLWNKNRNSDVCTTEHLGKLAMLNPGIAFVSTFAPDLPNLHNMYEIGLKPHREMMSLVQHAAVYLSTTKETFGIGVLEALAAGTPVLGFAYGGNMEIVEHGVNGYLARPGDYDDLQMGLEYCINYREVLSKNAILLSKNFSWMNSIQKLDKVFRETLEPDPPTVSIVIPCYNKSTTLARAVESAIGQTYPIENIAIVNDGSTDSSLSAAEYLKGKYPSVKVISQENQGVAHARNHGIASVHSKYICCLDGDDEIHPDFISTCVDALEKDRALGMAYTNIFLVGENGEAQQSQWPGEFDYDAQVKGRNQVPTCCVFRRSAWERLGGYRQRYAPQGAGAEDAEFWLRIGSIGFNGKRVSERPLFIYHLGGATSKREYSPPNWTNWHPWVKDSHHPFASMASSIGKFSHSVVQYDEPVVSVIIPVGPNHSKVLLDALDSLEAQTFRKWEAIVIWDSPSTDPEERLALDKAYPFVRWFYADAERKTPGEIVGAGAARNIGAEKARSNLLLFLDADDWLEPTALEKILAAWQVEQAIIYTDYYGKAVVDNDYAAKMRDRLIARDPKTNEATIRYFASDYDCQRASQQPNTRDMYIWCNITSLVPRLWHDEIGGFDEDLVAWEDWDYWIRMAASGKCFVRVAEPLLTYRFYTGSRRERGLHDHQNLIEYLQNKYKDTKFMCKSCGNKNLTPPTQYRGSSEQAPSMVSDSDYVLISYDHPNRGQHKVIGPASATNYGYRGGGEQFLVLRKDMELMPHIFKEVKQDFSQVEVKRTAPPPPIVVGTTNPPAVVMQTTNPPVVISTETKIEEKPEIKMPNELDAIPGITPSIVEHLNKNSIYTIKDLDGTSIEKLMRIKGFGQVRAQAVKLFARKYLEEKAKPK